MKKLLVFIMILCLFSCKTWEWGETFNYHIPAGQHSDIGMPMIIEGTERWGGEMTLDYDPFRMIDTVENFAYWNKFGGIMPDLTDNFIPGKHQSARAAWRVDPEDPAYIYMGYIVYVWGREKPYRGYLLDQDSAKVRVPVGETFWPIVTKYSDRWGVYVKYKDQEAEIRVNDKELKREKMMVVMDPYYGGEPVAPTDIYIELKIIDTTWIY